ncbi:MAG: hypothetical protein A2Y25_03760 [Candidatus Melainabacteria bacterium GWF2_37_15]|nr:MAG: hypothetical protein A2Y25_03760 [Candidatus Melainabacteria bacterium GWF2_37_15]
MLPQPKETPIDNGEFKEQSSSKKQEKVEYYSQKTISIETIIQDFNKTLAAIGAPQDINEEVQAYLKLVDTQSLKEKPSPKLIKSNLKNAANILDEYITETLQKSSKVVTDWVEALLLQNVNYKAEKIETPEVEEQQVTQPEPVKEEISELNSLYQEAGKLADTGKLRKALITYDKLLPEVKSSGDKSLETKIYLDKAYIYDVNKDFPSALENYNNAANLAKETGNDKIRALSHYNMASIYDEFGKTNLALSHYYEALSYDGQIENLRAQTQALNDVGNIFSTGKQYRQAIDHYHAGLSLTKETEDTKGKAFLLSNIATVFKDVGEDQKALKYYKKSIECDMKIGNLEGYSINYEYSADIMQRNNYPQKAENLYKKSLDAAQKLGDKGISTRILEKLERNNLSY